MNFYVGYYRISVQSILFTHLSSYFSSFYVYINVCGCSCPCVHVYFRYLLYYLPPYFWDKVSYQTSSSLFHLDCLTNNTLFLPVYLPGIMYVCRCPNCYVSVRETNSGSHVFAKNLYTSAMFTLNKINLLYILKIIFDLMYNPRIYITPRLF